MSRNQEAAGTMRYAAVVEYDGSNFCGWQRQAGVATVQAEVESALSRVADHPVTTVCAGRTDTGVHATGQVIHFESPARRTLRNWVRGVNTHLPAGISMVDVRPVDQHFHARFSARRRHYRYIIFCRSVAHGCLGRYVTWVHHDLDAARMALAASYLKGSHDYSAFRASACQARSPLRTVYELTVNQHQVWTWIDVEADGFLHHMVRNIAGVLICIGSGEQPESWSKAVLESRDRTLGAVTAPASGLYLCKVDYEPHFSIVQPLPAPVFW